jgi:hypothetical protein
LRDGIALRYTYGVHTTATDPGKKRKSDREEADELHGTSLCDYVQRRRNTNMVDDKASTRKASEKKNTKKMNKESMEVNVRSDNQVKKFQPGNKGRTDSGGY